jgi:4-alpha-glucanotransferase
VDRPLRPIVRDALAALGVRRLLLGIHDPAFPSLPREDVGRGSPYSDGAGDLLELAAALGFDGLQLGPQGATSAVNPSPYDGTLFSRNPLSVALAPLTRPEWGSILDEATLEAIVAARPGAADRVSYAYAFETMGRALAEATARFRALRARRAGGVVAELAAAFDAFRAAHAGWLARDALYDLLQRRHGGRSWREWPPADREHGAVEPGPDGAALLAAHADAVEEYAFVQFLAHAQHAALWERGGRLGLALFGDLQVGMSERDAWAAQALVLPDWRMGAPPSRTDPGGQAWNYPVLDPRLRRARDASGARGDGPALRFFRARVRKLLAEYDGMRIDHPHGLVCPWVYRAGPDPDAAVRAGARLFESPGLPDHPELAAFAIARQDQLDASVPRHADAWVTTLDREQVDRYAELLDVVMESARDREDIAAEILSTQPYPLRRVIERHGLGRFRVTQKADLASPDDVYRGENAGPRDWIMLGSHDTRPIWILADGWVATGASRAHAEYLASRLLADGEDRDGWIRAVASDPLALAQAHFAALFVGPARNVMVFFSDLFGDRARYNTPGRVSDANWSVRLPADFAEVYARRVPAGRALDLPRALARAMRSRGASFVSAHRQLLEALEGGRS